ncbi:MAG TPA: fumarylacetoacetase [Streptosporangiaceae bacterium]|nr:fumarylacetoacetase [Streptosporangiaceae bacterium]
MDDGFGLANLPYGVFAPAGGPARCGVRFGDRVLDLAAALDDPVFAAGSLNGFMAQGRERWTAVRERVADLLGNGYAEHLYPLADVTSRLPFTPGDYVDFYASEYHATNVGRIFRPDGDALTPNWKHLPIGYHGRSGTIVPSGTPVIRPSGQRKAAGVAEPVYGASRRLDFEAEVGFVIGTGSALGSRVTVADFGEHVFGVFLLNDWSARDIQAWEYVPLGPFLGKSFATSISPWIVPLDALAHRRVAPPPRSHELLEYLSGVMTSGLDLDLEVRLNGNVISRPPFSAMYWTPAQMLAHMTVNGASTRTGDCYASGTVSGPEREQRGCLLELSWGGTEPLSLPDGTTRTFLEDGDELTISATAGPDVSFGEVAGVVKPAVG